MSTENTPLLREVGKTKWPCFVRFILSLERYLPLVLANIDGFLIRHMIVLFLILGKVPLSPMIFRNMWPLKIA